MYSPLYSPRKQKKTISLFLGDFKLYERYNNISLLKLKALKEEEVIEPRLKFSYVFLIGNSNLIENVHRTLEGHNKIQLLGQKLTIGLSFFTQLKDCFISHELFENENSWTEVFENVKIGEIRNDLLNKGEKDSLLLPYQSEKENNVEVAVPEFSEETNWLNKKNDLIRELKREVRNEVEIKEKIENIKNLSNQRNKIGKWIYEVFFSDSTNLRIENKTPSEILNGLEAELLTINGVDSTLSEEDDAVEGTVRDTEEGETVSENEGEREELSVSTDNDKEDEEGSETTKESSAPPLPENEKIPNAPTKENSSENETMPTTDQERVDIPETSLLEKIGKNNLIIGSIVIIVALILVVVSLIIRKKKVNKTSPNKLQPEQPIDKKDIDYGDSFAY